MPPAKGQKERSRTRILDVAAMLFSRFGYDATGIDTIMAEAGLTRGAFYAHFPSKAALLAEVIATRNTMTRRLRERPGDDALQLHAQAKAILQDLLVPVGAERVDPESGFSSLAGDVARAPEAVRQAFAGQIDVFWTEIFRGRDNPPDAVETATALRLLSLAVGALALARATDNDELSHALLASARGQVDAWMMAIGPADH